MQAVGATAADWDALKDVGVLGQVLLVLRRQANVVPRTHIIDCDAPSFCREQDVVVSHREHGVMDWSAAQIDLWLSERQKRPGHSSGRALLDALSGAQTANANVLDYLLKEENWYIIPEPWKGVKTGFWGTVYKDATGSLFVRCLCWHGSGWAEEKMLVRLDFTRSCPVAIIQ